MSDLGDKMNNNKNIENLLLFILAVLCSSCASFSISQIPDSTTNEIKRPSTVDYYALRAHHSAHSRAESRYSAESYDEVDDTHLTPEEIGRVAGYMKSRSPQIRQCYERSLKKNTALQGRFNAMVRLNSAGKIANVLIINDTLDDDSVSQCAIGVIRRWNIPARGPATFSVPYSFAPQNPNFSSR